MQQKGTITTLVQMVLDIFEPESGRSPKNKSPRPPAGPFVAGEPLLQVLPRAKSVHPRANRRIQLGTTDIEYSFKTSKRRTIGMVVGPEGLEVRAPRWVSYSEVEQALIEKAEWIEQKMLEMSERQQQLGARRVVWRNGVCISYLGDDLRVELDSSPALKKGSVQLEDQGILSSGLVDETSSKPVCSKA
jgi:Protein of unknown function DUF45